MAKKKKIESGNAITDLFRQTIEKDNLGIESNHCPNYPTGIDIIDYYNGRIEDDEILAGVDGGKIITIVGKSGSGKSTLGLQFACKIVGPYDNGQIIHLDFERATNKARFKTLSKWDDDTINSKYIHLDEEIYSETLYKLVKSCAKIKLENYDDFKIDTKKVDHEGEKIYELPPTVVLIDSWATVIPKDISSEEDLSGQMSATSIARTNNSIIKRLTGPMSEANIILIVINHITQKVEIGPVKTSNTLNYLGQDESLPGGTSVIYMANVLIKLQASSKLEKDKDFGIKGFFVTGNFLKTRSNESGKKFDLVFSQSEGFDNFLTNFYALKSAKLLKGNGRAYYFDFDPETKFTQKTVKQLYLTDKSWAKKFDKTVKNLYYDVLNKTAGDVYLDDSDDEENEEEFEFLNCIDEENDIWECSDGIDRFSDGEIVEYEEE